MGALFDANSERIHMGTGVAPASTWSVGIRLSLVDWDLAVFKGFMCLGDGTLYTFYLGAGDTGGTNMFIQLGLSTGSGASYPEAQWDATKFTNGSIHSLFGTYDGTNLRLYADTDATAKVTAAAGTPDTGGTQQFIVGNDVPLTQSPLATIYEAMWWPGSVRTGAECAQMGGGNATGITLPANHWGLIADALDTYGGDDGTVTGATFVAHDTTNLFPPSAVSPLLTTLRPRQDSRAA